ncbi:hypothetical protein XELAEV_18029093mg [Xenopus laevis]|uniref:Uncharacterized protein n=1 Tax=Xenopus laevis TaxID=8355 RepID=A0A974CTB5_XENLA|nr:hypothetical protein XELAEV_18029093mg [Xenopus laevis]
MSGVFLRSMPSEVSVLVLPSLPPMINFLVQVGASLLIQIFQLTSSLQELNFWLKLGIWILNYQGWLFCTLLPKAQFSLIGSLLRCPPLPHVHSFSHGRNRGPGRKMGGSSNGFR